MRFTLDSGRQFTATFHRDWAPIGADRVWQLGQLGYYRNNSFFRVIPGFVVQFGISNVPDTALRCCPTTTRAQRRRSPTCAA
jgi:cyclophilin family peptidyl-prolyl cis-trans isomerase